MVATITELPLVIVDIQRGGPSTGLPTKTEASDLMMALYGRHGEAPCGRSGSEGAVTCCRQLSRPAAREIGVQSDRASRRSIASDGEGRWETGDAERGRRSSGGGGHCGSRREWLGSGCRRRTRQHERSRGAAPSPPRVMGAGESRMEATS